MYTHKHSGLRGKIFQLVCFILKVWAVFHLKRKCWKSLILRGWDTWKCKCLHTGVFQWYRHIIYVLPVERKYQLKYIVLNLLCLSQLPLPATGGSPGRLHPLPGFHGWGGQFSSAPLSCVAICIVCVRHNHHDNLLITDRGSTKLPETTTDWSCALDEGLLWPLHSVSVSSHWAWTMGRSPSGYPQSVGAGGPAVQDQSGTRTRGQAVCPLFPLAAHIWRNSDIGCPSV